MKVTELYDEETLEYIGDVEELSGKIADLTKTASKPGGISLFTDETKTTYKSTYQLLKDISEIYNELTDKQQAGLLEALAGKRQGQIVAATINNFSAVEEALKNMENSAGSAEAEMEIIRDSAEYAMNRLKETFTSLAQHSVSRGGLKDLINVGTTILEIVDGIVSQIGLIPTILTTIFGIMSAKKNIQTGFFDAMIKDNGKIGFNFMGAQVGKGWSERRTALKAEMTEYKNAVNTLYNGMKNGQQETEAFKNAYVKAMSSSSLAVQEFANKAKAGTATTKDLNKATATLGKTANSTHRYVKLLNTAISMLTSMGISMAINAIITGFQKLANWVKDSKESANEYADEAKNIESQIEDINEQLVTTQKRINELKAIENPTIIEQEELDKLQKTNDELERMLKILQAEQKDKANQAANAAVEWWRTVAGYDYNYADAEDWFKLIPRAWGQGFASFNNETYSAYKNAISEYIRLQDEIVKKQQELTETTDESYYKILGEQIEKLIAESKKYENIAEKNYTTFATKMAQLNPDIPEQQNIINWIKEINGWWEKVSGKNEIDSNLVDILNNYKFTEVKDQLVSLWKQGKLTEEEFNKLSETTVDGLEEFKKALKDNGYENFAEIIRAISEYFKDNVKDINNATRAAKDFATVFEKLQERIDKFISNQDKLTEAFKKVELGGKLSNKEVYELFKDMPELIQYLTDTSEGWTISSENFVKASNALTSTETENLQNQIDVLQGYVDTINMAKSLENELNASGAKRGKKPNQKLLDEYNAYLEKVQQAYDALEIDIDVFSGDAKLEETSKKLGEELSGLKFLLDLTEKAFNNNENAIEGINEAYEKVKTEVSDYNSNIKTLESSIKSLNEGSLLSYDEMNAIIEIAPKLQSSFEKQGEGYTILTSAIEEWRDKSLEARNEYIDGVIAQTEAEITAVQKTKEALQDKEKDLQEQVANLGVDELLTAAIVETRANISDVDKKLNVLYDTINKLKGLRKDLTDDDKKEDNSLSDKLQQQIDYYKTIISAVETVRDKYTEAIDKEIDALNDGKDALKEANDERQRELDLIEARNNLENAKKRKVWVYSEANGFQQVQDEKAVREAEEKYRDAIQDVQEAEIDKQIDALEKKKEEIEERVKDLTELEENINNSATVAEALKTLGLSDEKDLMSLSDSVKQGIKEGLTEAIVNKNNEDNKDNDKYTPVTLDDVLSNLGAKVTSADIEKLGIITKKDFDSAVKSFADSLKEYQEANVSNVTNNNSGMVVSPTFNISGVTDPEEVAKVVNSEMTNLFTKLNNSIK